MVFVYRLGEAFTTPPPLVSRIVPSNSLTLPSIVFEQVMSDVRLNKRRPDVFVKPGEFASDVILSDVRPTLHLLKWRMDVVSSQDVFFVVVIDAIYSNGLQYSTCVRNVVTVRYLFYRDLRSIISLAIKQSQSRELPLLLCSTQTHTH